VTGPGVHGDADGTSSEGGTGSGEEGRPTSGDAAHRVGVGLQTAVVDNSTAFGFSVTVTASYGALDRLAADPSLGDVAGFAVCAAAAFALLQVVTTRGFRRRPGTATRQVVLLGTAFDIVSVALGVGTAMLVGAVVPAWGAWALGGFLASLVFTGSQAIELVVAARLERREGELDATS
jgi:hypothetical protein